jgi:hypothetical protein
MQEVPINNMNQLEIVDESGKIRLLAPKTTIGKAVPSVWYEYRQSTSNINAAYDILFRAVLGNQHHDK